MAARSTSISPERQLLEALLIPSVNNIARLLAARVAGSQTRFIAGSDSAAQGCLAFFTHATVGGRR